MLFRSWIRRGEIGGMWSKRGCGDLAVRTPVPMCARDAIRGGRSKKIRNCRVRGWGPTRKRSANDEPAARQGGLREEEGETYLTEVDQTRAKQKEMRYAPFSNHPCCSGSRHHHGATRQWCSYHRGATLNDFCTSPIRAKRKENKERGPRWVMISEHSNSAAVSSLIRPLLRTSGCIERAPLSTYRPPAQSEYQEEAPRTKDED